ncbi:PMS1 protein homolog 1-like isoform X2 [Thrips palmi]|uniref:PMS1 protein homolog 1-like isoform X2 n=1 Tax=Thrips palmi TaxID=161013 RepID=A0A6P8ZPN8_THRPL|nr:PMS1 protein homolog 1-like isoform X2 [Thrips palmi]
MSLAQLPAATVKLITSSQIITSTSSAVKELFENALDAGATSVEVKLINFGLDRIEVKDNGSGISKENTTCMALPHYTSKISNFTDLETLQTYGFRGEALNALCRVGQVTLTTATASDPMATVYTLDSSGNICGTKPSHHVQGTTVTVSNLFKNLPVRRQLMGSSRKSQEELKQVESVVKSLAVIKPNVRVTLSHNKCLIWQKTQCSNLSNSFAQLVGYSTSQQMEMLSLKVNEEISVEMLVPKRNCDISMLAKSTPVFSFIFVNERPVLNKKLIKVLHQQLTVKFKDNFSPRKFAVCMFSISVIPSSVDVNLEPNKTKVLIKDEDVVLSEIEKQLQIYYSVPCPEKEIGPNEPVREKREDLAHSPPLLDSDESGPTKKRKLEDEDTLDDLAVSAAHKTHQLPETNEALDSLIELMDSDNDFLVAESETKRVEPDEKTSQSCQPTGIIDDRPQKTHSNNSEFTFSSACSVTEASREKEKLVDEDLRDPMEAEHCHINNDDADGAVSASNHFEQQKSKINSERIQAEQIPNANELGSLWEDVSTNDIDDMSVCLDALEFAPEASAADKCNRAVNGQGAGIVGTVEWSMGHVSLPKGDTMKGSGVLIGKQPRNAADREEVDTGTYQVKQLDMSPTAASVEDHLDGPSMERHNKTTSLKLESPQKSPKAFLSPKSPRSSDHLNKTSPGMDSSLQSVSSQMGRRELAAFTKFAREARPQIILENPGIAFTHVATMLSDKWQSLSDTEKEHYEEIARKTATTKKIWKTADKQKKLEWVKKLPEKQKIAKPSRPPRKETLNSISVDDIRDKVSKASLSIERGQQFYESKSGICLLGQLEPSGTWVCLEKSVLSILNHSRLQEVVINHRLLSTYALPMIPLPSIQRLDPVILGEAAWKVLVSLPCKFDELRQTRVISADIIAKNGFKIEMSGDNQHANLTEVAQALNYYGVKELKETLTLGSTWSVVELFDCRPLRVANHIKSEAMRICRKSPTALSRTMVEELLEYWRTVMLPKDVNCLHAKPIMAPLYNLVEKAKLCP